MSACTPGGWLFCGLLRWTDCSAPELGTNPPESRPGSYYPVCGLEKSRKHKFHNVKGMLGLQFSAHAFVLLVSMAHFEQLSQAPLNLHRGIWITMLSKAQKWNMD